jgi:predicted TIM-barrel fold metal-dependent hydrolase
MQNKIKAIDVHGHLGIYKGSRSKLLDKFYSGDADLVVSRARMANTELTLVSSYKAFLPRFHGKPIEGNTETVRMIEKKKGLMQWIVINPLMPETFKQAEVMLELPKSAGIKIHPEEHGYEIRKYGRKIFEFAQRNNAIVQSHSGDKNSMPENFVNFANDFPDVKIIISHLGCGWDGDMTHQVRAIQRSRNGNLYTDTSSAKSITPGLVEWAVKEIGASKILYGTDTPCYFAPIQRARIDNAEISEKDKRRILRENSLRLFGSKLII